LSELGSLLKKTSVIILDDGVVQGAVSSIDFTGGTVTVAGSVATVPLGSGGAGSVGPMGLPGADGQDGQDGVPGLPGANGAAGPSGADGIIGYTIPGRDGEDGQDSYIPGPIGPAGAGGVTPKRSIGICFDGGGSTPTVGSIGYVVAQLNGTIDQWAIVSDASGSAVIDVWKAAGAIPTVANTIAGTEKPTLASQQLNSDTALTTWTTPVLVGDVFGFKLDSVATLTRVTAEVRITESA
jgi:hypothetical protein